MRKIYDRSSNRTVPTQVMKPHDTIPSARVVRVGSTIEIYFPLQRQSAALYYEHSIEHLMRDSVFGEEKWEMITFSISTNNFGFRFEAVRE